MNKPIPGQGTEPERSDARRGLRHKIRIGPGENSTGVWSPMPQSSIRTEDTLIADEAKKITRALMDLGELSGHELRQTLGARYWGPRRFNRAIHYALDKGLIRKVGHDRYMAPQLAPGEKKEESEQEAR